MTGNFIGVSEKANTFVAEKKFTLKKFDKATLRATALGLYFAEINGVRVGDAYLTPGWTSYNKMLQVQEYDVTSLLRTGENVLALTVNTGWYSGRLTWDSKTEIYGEQSAVCAELIIGDAVIATDKSWTAKESHIRESGIYDGETQDFTAKCKPLTLCEVPFDKTVLTDQISEPVRDIECIAVKEVIRTPKGELVYDFGQNMAGVVQIVTPKDFDGTFTVQFAEILVGGNFYTDNMRSAKATDSFTVKGAKTLSPEFTFHGFRYMKLIGAQFPKENITAIVRHTDMPRTGYITTDNARFNRLYENVIWGQKGNFVDIPTDCPQRDERLGWTGDINAFCATAAYNFDVRKIFKKWLADVRNDQCEDGRIPSIVPNAFTENDVGTYALWSDAVTMVPWKLYEMYGDISYLSDNYEAMKKFIAAREANCENGLIMRGFEYGDWLALDKEVSVKESPFGRTDGYFISSIFYAESLRIVADSARLLGKRSDEKTYNNRRIKLIEDIRCEYFTPNGRLAIDTVTAQAIALYFHIVEDKHRAKLAKELNENVLRHDCHMTTGFIGSPYLLFALADNGYFQTAEKVLFNNEFPGWLYEVDMGATTIWERWNSLLPDGTPNPDGMNSYNHYAYGSVMEFVYKRIAGIQAQNAGFAKVKIAPMPLRELRSFSAQYNSVHGKISVTYKITDGKITYTVEIPEQIEGEIYLPDEGLALRGSGKYEFVREWYETQA